MAEVNGRVRVGKSLCEMRRCFRPESDGATVEAAGERSPRGGGFPQTLPDRCRRGRGRQCVRNGPPGGKCRPVSCPSPFRSRAQIRARPPRRSCLRFRISEVARIGDGHPDSDSRLAHALHCRCLRGFPQTSGWSGVWVGWHRIRQSASARPCASSCRTTSTPTAPGGSSNRGPARGGKPIHHPHPDGAPKGEDQGISRGDP
jgi:hypothetical protein